MVNAAVTLLRRLDRNIVDQPGPADGCGGDQPHPPRRLVEGLESRGINQSDVIDRREACIIERLPRLPERFGDRGSGLDRIGR
jgi:hypothetical protein